MHNRAYIIKTDGTIQHFDTRPTLDEAQQAVGGYIEILPIRGTMASLVVNEDGRALGLPANVQATTIFGSSLGSVLVGNVVVLEGWKTVGA